ncbi:MAG: trehalose-phosphatase [Candidatus Omnitrophota bacterium]|nr:trehalose-phosphatase [Candidatus Omnitrophota bacterium]
MFLDYDGTLTPIVERPELAILSRETKEVLEKLIRNERFHVFVVSGRAMADVKMLVGIDNIVYIGNHGLEIEGAGIDFGEFPFARFREVLEYLKLEINKELIFFKGAFIEDKGLGLSVHYRMLNLKEESIFKIFFERITKEFSSRNEIRIVQGKKVFEIRPPIEWDKGKAVLWLLKAHEEAMNNQKAVAVYIGDDQTDEDAFKALNKIATTIHIGNPQSTAAKYFLESPQDVTKFLRCLVDLKGHEE